MLDTKYKRNPSDYKFDAPYNGFKLCCGVKPKVDFDSTLPNAQYYVGHIACPVCDRQCGVIANGGGALPERVGFLYREWNEHECFKSNPIEAPDGFKAYQFRATFLQLGHKQEFNRYFQLIKIEDGKLLVYCWYRNKIIEFPLPERGKLRKWEQETSVQKQFCSNKVSYLVNGWHDGRQLDTFMVTVYNYKWAKQIQELFHFEFLNRYD